MKTLITLFTIISVSFLPTDSILAQEEKRIESKNLQRDFDQLLEIIEAHPDQSNCD